MYEGEYVEAREKQVWGGALDLVVAGEGSITGGRWSDCENGSSPKNRATDPLISSGPFQIPTNIYQSIKKPNKADLSLINGERCVLLNRDPTKVNMIR
ncbi:hypothetical protein L2E82_50417 [Cichorium intybus]|nr:hypothetical protein L2E82_50417 [Cichorium intybus]